LITSTSRYQAIPLATRTTTAADGTQRQITYFTRRFLPRTDSFTIVQRYTVKPGDRLDLLANTFAGDPTQYWRLCDASGVMWPEELNIVGATVVSGIAKQ
jgi:hypothetical protein